MQAYVHGYTSREAVRLHDQAQTVQDLIHNNTFFTPGSRVLEVGCGVGAQTITLAQNNPDVRFVSIDISEDSLAQAQARVENHGLTNVELFRADLFSMPFPKCSFDHIFICFVLEHLPDPVWALRTLKTFLVSDGSLTVFEGDHGSCYFHPEAESARRAWQCLIDVQARLGGDSLIGRKLYPLLIEAGFREVGVSPKMVYMDDSLPGLMDGFVRKTIIPMVEGVKVHSLEMNLIDQATWEDGIRCLHHVADCGHGSFCYTFFKAQAVKL